MSPLHPLRKVSTGVTVLAMSRPGTGPSAADDDIEASIATVAAIGGALDRLQARLDEQGALIAELKKENGDLAMHKEAAYSEMSRSEAAMRVERARADRAEQSRDEAEQREREAQDKLGRLMSSVRETFGRAERTSAA